MGPREVTLLRHDGRDGVAHTGEEMSWILDEKAVEIGFTETALAQQWQHDVVDEVEVGRVSITLRETPRVMREDEAVGKPRLDQSHEHVDACVDRR